MVLVVARLASKTTLCAMVLPPHSPRSQGTEDELALTLTLPLNNGVAHDVSSRAQGVGRANRREATKLPSMVGAGHPQPLAAAAHDKVAGHGRVDDVAPLTVRHDEVAADQGGAQLLVVAAEAGNPGEARRSTVRAPLLWSKMAP